ncbi:hypothetical protein BH10PSE2_BH10PSE2_23890 [soil metagenome]
MRTALIAATSMFAALMFAATPGLAQTAGAAPSNGSSFTLKTVASTPQAPVLIDGATWRCNTANVCTASGGASQPAPRACRRVVARVGVALASFTYKGVTLSDDQLATCNVGTN